MKKIIYSLVIMIAAGSLFTSCIDQVEPDGILALREAKARYYDALVKLRGADAELRQAEAAYKLAEAALKQAEAAHQQAVTDAFTKMQALERELKELEIEAMSMENELRAAQIAQEIDAIEKEMEIAEKQHEIDLIKMQEKLAKAQESLRVVLRDIALNAQDLTAAEKQAVIGAAMAYLEIWEAVQDQKIEVMEAEKALADAQRAKEVGQYNPDYAWDSETHSYQNLVDLYSRAIERAKGFIEEDKEALENVPELPDVDAWEAELQTYQAIADLAEYSRHELTQEAAAYYVTYVHDGVKAYNDAVDAWIEENPAVANPGTAPKAPAEKDYPASKYGLNDTITFPTLEQKTTPAYAKFEYLLDSYMTQESPVSKADPKNNMILVNSEGEYDIVATVAMKDFILGDEFGDVETQKVTIDKTKYTADYGLKGAVSVLLRDKVLNPDVPADPEKAREAADKARDEWQADHDTLAAGLLAYQPYVDAVAAYEAKVTSEGEAGDAMVKAVNDLMEALGSVNNVGISKNDSVAIMDGIAAFAAAREAYFDYTWDPEGTDKFDRKFYWFGNTIGDTLSIAWSAVTYEALRTNEKFGVTLENQKKYCDPATDKEDAIGHMVYQLVNSTFGKEIHDNDPAWSFDLANINDDNCKAFYTLYKYIPESAPGANDAHFVLNDGMDTPYTSAELTALKKAVDDAIAAYKDCYERYWNETWPADGTITSDMDAEAVKTAIEANPDTDIDKYTLATFTEPFILPNAWDAANVPTGTNALGAILGSVDPAATQPKAENLTFFGGTDESVVFGTAADPTDINVYLYAEYLYQLALNPAVGDIAEIQAWVEEVEAAFDDQVTAAEAAAKKAYDDAVTAYNKAKDTYDKAKAKYDAYQTALGEFTGLNKDKKPNGLKKITGSYPDVASIQYKFEFVNVVDGEWVNTLGGKQLELANQIFPDFPEKLNEWYNTNEEIDDTIAHAQILIAALKPAYYAAAKAAGYTEALDNAATYDELIENYEAMREAYIDALEADIEAQEAEIDANMKLIADFESADSQADIDIAKAQAELDKENKKLNAMEEVLKGARENLDRILAYIQTLDVNFVIIPTDIPTGILK